MAALEVQGLGQGVCMGPHRQQSETPIYHRKTHSKARERHELMGLQP